MHTVADEDAIAHISATVTVVYMTIVYMTVVYMTFCVITRK